MGNHGMVLRILEKLAPNASFRALYLEGPLGRFQPTDEAVAGVQFVALDKDKDFFKD
jgi:hypothetical protein